MVRAGTVFVAGVLGQVASNDISPSTAQNPLLSGLEAVAGEGVGSAIGAGFRAIVGGGARSATRAADAAASDAAATGGDAGAGAADSAAADTTVAARAPPTRGTLERSPSLNRNIVGGVDTAAGYRGHHLIPVSEAQQFDVMQHAADTLGYNINRGSNGISLPSKVAESLATGLPLHNGMHLSAYFALARTRLGALQRAYDAAAVTDSTLLEEIAIIEDGMRSDLVNDRIRLQSADPRP